MSYSALISKLTNVREHPNADRLNLATVRGCQVVVGKDSVEGDVVIFFPVDGQLSDAYCKENNLYPEFDAEGKRVGGGYFDVGKARVRAQAFRGSKSEGYVAPLSSVLFTGVDLNSLVEDFAFTELKGVEICSKYVTKATLRARGDGNKTRSTKRGETKMFKKHFDTPQFKFFAEKIPANREIVITEKLHGTSQRFGRVMDEFEVPLTKWQQFVLNTVNFFNKNAARFIKEIVTEVKQEWVYMNGTRNVIIQDNRNTGFYGEDEGFRQIAVKSFEGNLRKGETIFFEIVGYTNSTSPIMGRVNTDILKDKAFVKQYGKEMIYSYGCNSEIPEKMFDVYVYRITMTNEDGVSVDLPWESVKLRCGELGVKHVPEMTKFYYDGNSDNLRQVVEDLLEGPSTLDSRHIREGVCVRVEGSQTAEVYKAKSFTFGVLEGYIKEKDDYVDAEEAA